jgi:hypothetical protein
MKKLEEHSSSIKSQTKIEDDEEEVIGSIYPSQQPIQTAMTNTQSTKKTNKQQQLFKKMKLE